ncbi:MAG: AbrB/MazE/SpoVT family DNA-binding domain-containing protein [Defluviitaleaceae bacterium]|nr:AbrB/MazE/SpoVT family DNA-binding domain-containing protein [Defluviitaleaceae bacterium]
MNLAKISCNGQITIPIEIRRELKVKSGDKIAFFRKENGEIILVNLNISAILETQYTAKAE